MIRCYSFFKYFLFSEWKCNSHSRDCLVKYLLQLMLYMLHILVDRDPGADSDYRNGFFPVSAPGDLLNKSLLI